MIDYREETVSNVNIAAAGLAVATHNIVLTVPANETWEVFATAIVLTGGTITTAAPIVIQDGFGLLAADPLALVGGWKTYSGRLMVKPTGQIGWQIVVTAIASCIVRANIVRHLEG